jgi:8-amino-7-oxononanoate synthase
MKNRIHSILHFARSNDLYPDLHTIEGAATPETVIEGKKMLMFSSNNYLGLSHHPEVIAAAVEAVKHFGVGSDGSRLLSGNLSVHQEFERKIALFKGGEAAIMWPSGYAANVGTITALMNPLKVSVRQFFDFKSVIFSDELNHASIVDGIKMSRQHCVIYRHRDVDDLHSKLTRHPFRKKLVVTDSVFSMDGDIAPLDKIAELCKKYNALLMIDEAHATGVLGERGHGSLEHFGLKAMEDVQVVLGTCSKALAATGGFVVGDQSLIDYLRVASRSYMFSTATTPAASAALIKILTIIERDSFLRKQLWENSTYLRDNFHAVGFNTLGSETQIIPILIGSDANAIRFSRELFKRDIYGPAVRWPAVKKGKARIRFTVMATHTKEQIDYLVQCCSAISRELGL